MDNGAATITRSYVRDDCDAIILGAGIGALLLASKLSEFLRVAVVEKRNRNRVRSHCVTKSVAVDIALAEAIETRYKSIEIHSDPHDVYRYDSDYQLWNLDKMAAILVRRIIDNGSLFFADNNSYSGRLDTDFVEIASDSRAWRAKVVIDFMGVRSPLSPMMPKATIDGLAVVLGGSVPVRTDLTAVWANMRLSSHYGFVERFPTPSGNLHLSLMVPANHLKRTSNVEQDLHVIFKRVSGNSGPAGLLKSFRGDIFASLKRRRHTRDRVVAFEDPEDCAMDAGSALWHALQFSADTAVWLKNCVKSRRTRGKDLASIPRIRRSAASLAAEKHLDDRILFGD